MRLAIFLMGLPAAGKSTTVAKRFAGAIEAPIGGTFHWIDPDAIKASHPAYTESEAFRVHDWSTEIAEQEFQRAITTAGADVTVVIDGTGTHADSMVRKMTEAREAGFTVELLYIKVTLATALARAAARVRQVPADVIRAKARDIATSFELVAPYADVVTVVTND